MNKLLDVNKKKQIFLCAGLILICAGLALMTYGIGLIGGIIFIIGFAVMAKKDDVGSR